MPVVVSDWEVPPDLIRPEEQEAFKVPGEQLSSNPLQSGGTKLIIDDSLESAWRRINLTLNRLSIDVIEAIEAQRRVRVRYSTGTESEVLNLILTERTEDTVQLIVSGSDSDGPAIALVEDIRRRLGI